VKIGRTKQWIWGAVAIFAVSLAADLGSKEWALGALSEPRQAAPPPLCQTDDEGRLVAMQRWRHGEVTLVASHLELRYTENCGAAFGLGNALPRPARAALFYAAAFIAVFFLARRFLQGLGGPMFAWSVPLIASGAVGNLVDRIRHGYVVDFIRFWWGSFEYPTFNIADAAITVGVVLMLLDEMKRPEKKQKKADASKKDEPKKDDVAEDAAKPQADA
jgi:signal peptidase II